jgi:hypothetical protein
LDIKNNAATFAPAISATGTDANINININPKGTGRVRDNGIIIPNVSSTDTLTNKTLSGGLATGDPTAALGLATKQFVEASMPNYTPADHSLVAWSGDPAAMVNVSAFTNGTLYLSKVLLRKAATISKLWYNCTTAAVSPVAGQNFIGLFDSSGTLLASASIDGNLTANVVHSISITPQNLAAGSYWVGMITNASTPPQFARSSGNNLMNAGLTAANYRFAVNGTGRTSMPATITPGSNSVSGVISLWTAIS